MSGQFVFRQITAEMRAGVAMEIAGLPVAAASPPPPAGGPQASFTVSQTTGCTCTSFSFADASTGATSLSWDFGDGSGLSTDANPTHVYATAGTWSVALTATGAGGGTSVHAMAISTVVAAGFVGGYSMQGVLDGSANPWRYRLVGDSAAFENGLLRPVDGSSIGLYGPHHAGSNTATRVFLIRTALADGTLSFDWSFTVDFEDDEEAGYVLGGTLQQPVLVRLARSSDVQFVMDSNENVVAVPATGHVSVAFSAGQQIGFYAYALQPGVSSGLLTISCFDVVQA
jgi:PKD repeat protein